MVLNCIISIYVCVCVDCFMDTKKINKWVCDGNPEITRPEAGLFLFLMPTRAAGFKVKHSFKC